MLKLVEILRCSSCGAESKHVSEFANMLVVVGVILPCVAMLRASDSVSLPYDVRWTVNCLAFVVFLLVLRWFKVNVCTRCGHVGGKDSRPG